MEKFARQALTDGVTNSNQLHVTRDSELFRVLNLHYNKSNDFRVSQIDFTFFDKNDDTQLIPGDKR